MLTRGQALLIRRGKDKTKLRGGEKGTKHSLKNSPAIESEKTALGNSLPSLFPSFLDICGGDVSSFSLHYVKKESIVSNNVK